MPEQFIRIMLAVHIAGGALALLSGLGAILTKKGSPIHRKCGKVYFFSMTAVFIGAVIVAIGRERDFLLMVAFFSYYLTVRGYRILSLKNLHEGTKPAILDLFILSLSGVFIGMLLAWGLYVMINGNGMGVVAIAFGGIGLTFLIQDIRNFINHPTEKIHWWYTHMASMGGSYIAATTAFLVVNIQLPMYNWVLWLLPSAIGGALSPIGSGTTRESLHLIKLNRLIQSSVSPVTWTDESILFLSLQGENPYPPSTLQNTPRWRSCKVLLPR